jgi:hypothetical protein
VQVLSTALAHAKAALDLIEEAVAKAHAKTALNLAEKAGSSATPVQLLELDIRGSPENRSCEEAHNTGRIQALIATNDSLRIESMGLYYMSVHPRFFALFGMHPLYLYWDAGKILVATQDTVREGLRICIHVLCL